MHIMITIIKGRDWSAQQIKFKKQQLIYSRDSKVTKSRLLALPHAVDQNSAMSIETNAKVPWSEIKVSLRNYS